jgi:hypothetical protein
MGSSEIGVWGWGWVWGDMGIYKYILSDGKSYIYFILYIKIRDPTTIAYMDNSARGDISYI